MGQTLRVPGNLQTRAAFEPASYDAEKGTVEVVWTTGARGKRRSWDGPYYEELEVSDKAIDLSRLNNGASVLNSHASFDVKDVVGVVEKAWIAGKEGRATIRFSDREEVKPIRADVQAGILRHISVGYSVQKYEQVEKVEDVPVYRATAWTPMELSLVPIAFDDGAMVRGQPDEKFNEVSVVPMGADDGAGSRSIAGKLAPEPSVINTRQEQSMAEEIKPAPAEQRASAVEEATRAAKAARIEEAKARAEAEQRAAEDARTAERERVSGIRSIARRSKLGDAWADALIANGAAVEEARAAAFDKLADDDESTHTAGHVRFSAGDDASDKFVRGASAWLFERCGVADVVERAKAKDPKRFAGVETNGAEFRGMSMLEIAREALERRNVKTRGMDRMTLAGLAFTHRAGYQTTGDFPILLENTLHKSLLAAYAITDDTWSKFCKVDTVPDFRASNRYRTGSLTVLDSVDEHGEFKNKAVPDGQKTSISVGTKGNIIAISRQTIVNDDMSALADLATKLGRAARLSIEVDVYALLAANSGLGPTQSDSQPFFHANRANVNATGAAIGVDALEADAVVMASQKDISSNEYLDLSPAVLLVPRGLLGTAKVLNDSQYEPTANKLQIPNKVRGLFREVIGTPRLSGTRRYLFADPSVAPAIVVAFLEGQGQAPVLDSENGWRVDGVEMKVRLDYKAQMFDPKGAVTNAGQ